MLGDESNNEEIMLIEGYAHCDGPCGVYDPASARVAAEAVQSMTKKMNALEANHGGSGGSSAAYINTMSRYAAIKEEEAQKCKDELLVLWTDFFKPQHLESTLIFTILFGKQLNYVLLAKLKFLSNMLKN